VEIIAGGGRTFNGVTAHGNKIALLGVLNKCIYSLI
jgi:hypothetical protein